MKVVDTRHVQKANVIFEPFINIISTYVSAIKKVPNEQAKPLKGGLDIALRIFTGTHASYVSKNLLDYLKAKKLVLNPFELIWEDRNKFGTLVYGNREMSYAVWEHTIPIREFREALILSNDDKEVREKINQYPGVAWITREEDRVLTKKSYLSSRPNGFISCYLEAGITLLTRDMCK